MNIPALVHTGAYRWEPRPVSSAGEAPGRLAACYHAVVLAIVCAVLYTNLPIYAYVTHPGLLPKFFYFGMFLLMLPLVIAHHRQLAGYLLSPFALWAGLLLLLNLAHLAGMAEGGALGGSLVIDRVMEARRDLVSTRMQYVMFAMVVGFAIHTCGAQQRRAFLWVAAGLALLVPAAVIADFLRPGAFYPLDTAGAVIGRASAMYINPTMAGEVLLHVFLLACFVTPARYRGPLFLLAGAAILTTFSRSAILAWILVFVALVCCKTLPRSAVVLTVVALGVGMLGFGMFEAYLGARGDLEGASGNVLARLDFFSNLSFEDDSSEERSAVLKAGWELFMQNPVFGAGPGATQFWDHRGGTHNQLLLFAAEYGFLGIGIWVWMVIILWRGRFFKERGLQFAMVLLFVSMSMFTHLMLDVETYWLVSLAIASAGFRPMPPVPRGRLPGQRWHGQAHAMELAQVGWSYAALGRFEKKGRAAR